MQTKWWPSHLIYCIDIGCLYCQSKIASARTMYQYKCLMYKYSMLKLLWYNYTKLVNPHILLVSFRYLERTPHHWHPNHCLVVKEIENVSSLKMAINFNHTMNFQDYGEKNRRRSELVLEVKRIFEELHIIYTLLPQEVVLIKPESTTMSSNR